MCENTKLPPTLQAKKVLKKIGTKFDIKIINNTYYTYIHDKYTLYVAICRFFHPLFSSNGIVRHQPPLRRPQRKVCKGQKACQ